MEKATKKWNLIILLEESTINELKDDQLYFPIVEQYMNCNSKLNLDDDTLESDIYHYSRKSVKYIINRRSSIELFNHTLSSKVDLVVCLGGDGTILNIAFMFQGIAPPVIAFRLGTLGFLTPFPFSSFRQQMKSLLEDFSYCVLRNRLCCHIIRKSNELDNSGTHDPLSSNNNSKSLSNKKLTCPKQEKNLSQLSNPTGSESQSTTLQTEYHFLNELVINRGLSPFLCDLMIKANGREVTNVKGDGLIVSTPTGSTAYSMTAGASMVHPHVPAFVLTPINSLSLSSRAIILPISMQLEIFIASNARCSSVHFSFDGRSRVSNLLHHGDVIRVSASPYPIPCLCGKDQAIDWFCGLAHCLNWNLRQNHNIIESLDPNISNTD